MIFENEEQEKTYKTIEPWVEEIAAGLQCEKLEDIPEFRLQLGSALAQTAVYPMGDDDAVISTRAYVVTGVDLTPDLMHFLLRENDRMTFGAFGIDQDGDIFFEHTIVGSTCDKIELKTSLSSVVLIADEYDDLIVEKWGGKRAIDRGRLDEEEATV